MVMTSPSMPVISEMLVTLRAPSLRRVCCTTSWMADGDLLAHRLFRQVGRAHRDHGLDTGQRVARRVGVDGGQRAVVAGVHGLQHVERFLAADLADDDAVGTHTQGVDDQLALANRALAFDVGRPGFEPRHVLLVQLQFGRVFDRHDALALGDEADSTFSSVVLPAPVPPLIRQFSLARTQCDRNSSIGAVSARRRDQVVRLEPLGRKPADRQQRPVDRQRRNDGVDARAVGQARVDHRRAVVDAAADAADDAVDDAQQVRVVLERGGDALQHGRRARRRPAACVLTRMSLIVGSRSSGSSGPRPNTSSRTSAKSVSRSARLSGVDSSASSWPSSVRISPPRASGRRGPAPRG